MKIDASKVRKCLKLFDFPTLFREQLGWDNHNSKLEIPIDGATFTLSGVAQKRGFAAYTCNTIPDRATRLKIDNQVTKSAREHFVIYSDRPAGQQVWQWVRREPGKPMASRDHRFDASQSGDHLIQRLEQIAVGMQEEESLTLFDVTGRTRAAFDVDKVTKKFYDRFKKEHDAFSKFIKGIKDKSDLEWYTSLMLNRLMFVYFIQKKGFLDGDVNYLQNRMKMVREQKGQDKFHSFYRYFLLRLFHEGLGKSPGDRKLDKELEILLGKVPYLNGGFFEVHQLEERNTDIDIPDKAFEKLFAFFDEFNWHLDERPLRADNEINPDVVGYIFEKYINQKQMGAYYTKEDITEYISKNTIIPFLFDAAEKKCPIAFKPDSYLWRMLGDNPDRYIYSAVQHGVIGESGAEIPLPKNISVGINNVAKRNDWNKAADDLFALPTETWREHVARRTRCLELREKLVAGQVNTINEFITLNLDIWQFARDAIVNCEGPELLRAFWQAIQNVTVLDPTCGSGAFLFAALQILESLYSDCLERMQRFVEDHDLGVPIPENGDDKFKVREKNPPRAVPSTSKKFHDFRKILADMAGHASERYFVLKSIIINNLFGVDIMEEAVEICKLRLFLKLVAQVERVEQIEPLPDIDFNIRAGNTLVGFVTLDQIRKSRENEIRATETQKMLLDSDAEEEIRRIEEDALAVDKAFQQFRAQQTIHGGKVTGDDKQELRKRLGQLDAELDRFLASEYGINTEKETEFKKWQSSHQPFHWFVEFHGIMSKGGFDVVIGNPPYLSTNKVSYLSTDLLKLMLPDLYAHVMLRSFPIASPKSRHGMIVPLSLTFSQDFAALRDRITKSGKAWLSSFDNIPAALFAGVSQRCTIWIGDRAEPSTHVTQMYRWRAAGRPSLIPSVAYAGPFHFENIMDGIPKSSVNSMIKVAMVDKDACDLKREVLAPTRVAKQMAGFSPSARNFVSAFQEPPPCLDDTTFKPVTSSGQGTIGIANTSDLSAAVISLVGEFFFHHWLTWGDGFHVTSGNVMSHVKLLEKIPEKHMKLIREIGQCLEVRRNEALVFKRNAGKYVGNFNFRAHSWLTRRADLVLMAGLGIDRDLALGVFENVQRVLAINEFAGEKSIPPSLKSRFKPKKPNIAQETATLEAADNLIIESFKFKKNELEFILNSDVRYGLIDDAD